MSCDFGVWRFKERLSDKAAGEVYRRLCEGAATTLIGYSILEHPSVDAFYSELTSLHPEIDDVPDERIDDLDYCPWSVAFDRSGAHLILCCAWAKADYVRELVHCLAEKHGLAVYDPQTGKIAYPHDPRIASSRAKPWWKFW